MTVYRRKLVLIGIALFLAVVAGAIPGCKAAQEKKPEATTPTVTNLVHSWGTMSDQETRINSKTMVKNPYPFPILLKGIEYQVLLGETVLVQGVITKNQELPTATETEVSFEAVLDNTRLSQLWITHIKNKEHTTFTYKGNMVFDLRVMEFKYPFKQSYEIKTNLLGQRAGS